MGILLNRVSPSLVNVSTKPKRSTMPCSKNFRRVAKNLWLSVFTTIQNLPKDEPRMDHMDLTSSMLSAIICKRDNTDTELVVMALTKHHPTEDTILTIAMTLTKNHPMDMILTTVMTPTNHHLTDMILISHHTMNMKNLLTRNHTNINMSPSHTMITKPLITIPMSPMIITQSLSMSMTKNIPIHLPNTSMATNHLSTRNMA